VSAARSLLWSSDRRAYSILNARGAVSLVARGVSFPGDRVKIATRTFLASEGKRVRLDAWPTRVDPIYESEDDYRSMLAKHVARLGDLQELLYASNRYALLVVFQGMDTSGKDGAIEHVMTGVNPQGCTVTSFKHPSATELSHDFLWRAVRELPERGHIGIFNRSYYEEVLIVRVHPELLAAESLPEDTLDPHSIWEKRFRSIRALERHLHANGTRIVKFFLHLSKEEQRKRFLARLDDPEKNWKFNDADVHERNYWGEYMKAYEAALSETSTKQAPWFVVPADDKQNARLIIARTIIDTLRDMPIGYPKTDAKRRKELQEFRRMLSGEDAAGSTRTR
jgi:PPK2 family polyphosphate:nucleotide phosphotransferase